jgi:hypothetical protein
VLVDPGDEVTLGRRRPDPDSGGSRAGETLRHVAVVMGEQDVGDAFDAMLGEAVEHVTAAEVDEDRLASAPDDIDVDRVLESDNALIDLHGVRV